MACLSSARLILVGFAILAVTTFAAIGGVVNLTYRLNHESVARCDAIAGAFDNLHRALDVNVRPDLTAKGRTLIDNINKETVVNCAHPAPTTVP